MVFEYVYYDTVAERKVPTARSGYAVTASGDGVTYYTNTYQFDASGREVFASQDTAGVVNDKQIVRAYFESGGPTPGHEGNAPFAARRDLLTRSQMNSSGSAGGSGPDGDVLRSAGCALGSPDRAS